MAMSFVHNYLLSPSYRPPRCFQSPFSLGVLASASSPRHSLARRRTPCTYPSQTASPAHISSPGSTTTLRRITFWKPAPPFASAPAPVRSLLAVWVAIAPDAPQFAGRPPRETAKSKWNDKLSPRADY
ncbi:hypothetical protein XA68_17722 [Ophiocordyceps unilateralis]|uniref:Uncharacterized protein n=1 Tax=Ophiocordyceps unilateralis TaxID=268505 RepID=A0A2A9PIH9_OPHUN|nr:hypothetical protein XA68_17722 [Ophiocordyceps unilateralis]